MTYEYVCTACGNNWEAEQSISAAPLKECPACKRETAKRQVSGGAGFILKGGGWYADLYGSTKPAGGSGAGNAKPSTEASTSSTSSTSESSSSTSSSSDTSTTAKPASTTAT